MERPGIGKCTARKMKVAAKSMLPLCFSVLLCTLALPGCTPQAPFQPAPTSTPKPTATFLPSFTNPSDYTFSLFHPTPTLLSLATDPFDNFEVYSGRCAEVASFDQPPFQENLAPDDLAGVRMDFDRSRYFSGDPLRLSATVERQGALDWYVVPGASIHGLVEDPASRRSPFELYDDGVHGDGKAGDGTFAFTLNDTLVPGIYKFLLQVTVPAYSGQDKVLEACYIAKAVYPVRATAGWGSGPACTSVSASEPIVVREAGEGGNDTTEYGRAAFYPKAVGTKAGILATWVVGFDGQAPVSNAYMRLLDANARPVGPVQLAFTDNVIGSPTLVRQGDNAVLDYCGRYHSNLDRIAAAFLDPFGKVLSAQVRNPTNRICNTGGTAIWTGSRMVFGWTDQASGASDHTALLEVADANGNSLYWKVAGTDVDSLPGLSVGHDRMLMVISTWLGTTEVHRFDLDGNEVAAPVVIEPFPYEDSGRIQEGYFSSAAAVPTADGWLIVSTIWQTPGVYITRLAEDGSLLSGPAALDTDLEFPNGLADVSPYRGGAAALGEIMGGYSILFISPDGTLAQRWAPEPDQEPINGSLFVDRDRLYVIYTSRIVEPYPASGTNQVRVRELECAP